MAPAEAGGDRNHSSPQASRSRSPSTSSSPSRSSSSSSLSLGGRHYQAKPQPPSFDFGSSTVAPSSSSRHPQQQSSNHHGGVPLLVGRHPYLPEGTMTPHEALHYAAACQASSPYLPSYEYHAALLHHHRHHPAAAYGIPYLPNGYGPQYDHYGPLAPPTQMLGWATSAEASRGLLEASSRGLLASVDNTTASRGVGGTKMGPGSDPETTCSATSAETSSLVGERVGLGEVTKKRVRLSHEERLQRSRERNRVHARKTRKRKKHQMESIQLQIEQMHEEARRLRLSIMEWYTANILLVMRAPQNGNCQPSEDSSLYSKYMAVQAYLDRYNAEMKVKQEGGVETGLTEGETTSNPTTESEVKSETSGTSENEQIVLAGPKGRSRYAPEDRERIRRERNRIHAKRTRDRRKKFMEDSEKVLARLTRENEELRSLVGQIYQNNDLILQRSQPAQHQQEPSHKDDDDEEEEEEEEDDDALDDEDDEPPRRMVIKRPKVESDDENASVSDDDDEEEVVTDNDDVNSSPVRSAELKLYGMSRMEVCV